MNVVGCCGIIAHLYKDRLSDNTEYVSSEPAEEILARESRLRVDEQLTKERAAREEQLAKETAVRDQQLAKERAEREQQAAREKAAKEEKRRSALVRAAGEIAEKERNRREAMPPPRIGMTKEQVINRTRWGAPYDVNRTTTASGTREQWVYGPRRYLYFDNGVLTAIQD